MKDRIEEIVENIAKCRYTGNPKTAHTEETYKVSLTIELVKALTQVKQDCMAVVEGKKREESCDEEFCPNPIKHEYAKQYNQACDDIIKALSDPHGE